ncbi:MAG: hypothetical protein M0R46_13400 [Candidatus Muirbacterium halophilum]|nr:hypothetical protein [Candidatus Muirbacterium halophilum]
MQNFILKKFDFIFLSMILIRSIVEFFFIKSKIPNIVFINHTILYYLIVYFFMKLLFLDRNIISELVFKKIFLLFFLIPFILGFFIPFSSKGMNYLEINNIKDFFIAYFSLLFYSKMNILIKLEAFTIIPGIFLVLYFYFKKSLLSSFLHTIIVYTFFLITGIFHYTTFITKYSPHDFMLMWQFLILSNLWMFKGRIKDFIVDIIAFFIFLLVFFDKVCIINWFNIIILVIVYIYTCYYIYIDLKTYSKNPLFIIPIILFLINLFNISKSAFFIVIVDLITRIIILKLFNINFKLYRLINNIYVYVFSLIVVFFKFNIYNI